MKAKITLFLLASLLLHGCNNAPKSYAIFEYEDFGPQVIAWEEIGMQWWQWDKHGGSDPKAKCDIKVVVYADLPLDEIKRRFPVDKDKKQDYRYLEFNNSLKYLEKNIRELEKTDEQWAVSLKERLTNTKARILQEIYKVK